MLFLLYDFNRTSDRIEFRQKVESFLLSSTPYKYETMADEHRYSLTIYDVFFNFSALQLIHSIETIADSNRIECNLLQFCFTSPDISKRK